MKSNSHSNTKRNRITRKTKFHSSAWMCTWSHFTVLYDDSKRYNLGIGSSPSPAFGDESVELTLSVACSSSVCNWSAISCISTTLSQPCRHTQVNITMRSLQELKRALKLNTALFDENDTRTPSAGADQEVSYHIARTRVCGLHIHTMSDIR